MTKQAPRASASSDKSRQKKRKDYKPPELMQWGSIKEITRGAVAGFQDGFASGTEPF